MKFFGIKKNAARIEPEKSIPRFVCRTCNQPGPFYVARRVTNWNKISDPWRKPDGVLTYKTYAVYLERTLQGTSGPPLAFYCGNCDTVMNKLEELIREPKED